MSNSPLVDYTRLSPNYSTGRNHVIDRITPHYMAGNGSVELCGEIFASPSRKASSNYGIGSDGRIGMYVEEKNRPWTSGSSYNDNRAITIECANLSDGSLTDACWNSLVALCVDICQRNGISKLNYTGDDTGNLTMHKWYQSTDCPGPWLSQQFGRLAREVNEILSGELPKPTPPMVFGGTYKCNVDVLNVRNAPTTKGTQVVAQYTRGDTVVLDDWYVSEDGYIWGRYTGANSGKYRYVAVGLDTGKPEPNDYLIKVS